MRRNYWSCSKFADWLRGTPKPEAGTAKQWSAWEKVAKHKRLRYWLAEEGLDHLQNFFCWPKDQFNKLIYYVKNRWITKTHSLTSNLSCGEWHDLDSRLLYSAFDELINFVEIDQAWMEVVFSSEKQQKYKMPWYRPIFRIPWRCPEAGMAHLKWAAGLKNDNEWANKNDPSFGQPTDHALAAQEIIVLYEWWKEGRPKRLDPVDASGWSHYYELKCSAAEGVGEDPHLICFSEDESDEEKEESRKILDACRKMEQEQEKEDTEMLIRLVKIRGSLWT